MGERSFDLFGNPVREGKGRRGRPAFEVTERNYSKVKLLLAMGWSNERVANAIECSPATLKRHFRSALAERDKMRDRLEAERLMVVAEQAMSGNVGAHRVLTHLVDRNDRMNAERQLSSQPKGERPGKKEERALAARDAEADLMADLEREARGGDVRH